MRKRQDVQLTPYYEWTRQSLDHDLPPMIENAADGSLLLLVPGGKSLVGGSYPDEGAGEPFEVELPPYYLAMHPVTNAQYRRFATLTSHHSPKNRPYTSMRWAGNRYTPEKADHPVVCVTWDDARAYCEWADARLPTELEWEKAARGVDGREFPWGNVWDSGKCRNGDNRNRNGTCNVWEFPEGCSPWGHYQMSGNVREWCQDWYDPGSYERFRQGNLGLPQRGTARVVRGGLWYHDGSDLFRCASRSRCGPGHLDAYNGFRITRSP